MSNSSYRVYYEDTDLGGIVYHANYLKFAERARTDWLRSLGFEQSELSKTSKVLINVYHLEIQFLSPAKLDDLLVVETQISEVKKASLKMNQVIKCNDKQLASLKVSLVCINLMRKPTGWPNKLYEAFLKTHKKTL